MKNILVTLSTLLLLTAALTINAADLAAGKEKAEACAGCHGMKGISLAPMFPNLAGQNAEYLESAMQDYRYGGRFDEMMSPVAKDFSDEDIADLAAYFSSLQRK